MKTLAAKEAKNRFGEMMDSVQYEPVTIEKNGRPVAVVLSIKDYQQTEQIKLEALQRDLAVAQQQIKDSQIFDYSPDLVDRIKANGRENLSQQQA